MSALAPTLQTFFTDYLQRQRKASPHTIAAYRDAVRLLLAFTTEHSPPTRHCRPRRAVDRRVPRPPRARPGQHHPHPQRGARRAPLALPLRRSAPPRARRANRPRARDPTQTRRQANRHVLIEDELDALLDAPDRSTWTGRRDHAIILLAAQTGLRADELIKLDCNDIHLGAGAHVNCISKSRNHRITPLIPVTVATIKAWLTERAGRPTDSLFPTRQGRRLSHDALEHRIAKHANAASRACPSLQNKKITPHILRHTAAVRLLQARVDTATIALWLGHASDQTTHIYLHADLTLKQRAIDRTAPPGTKPGRYRPPDPLLKFLENV